MAIALLNSTPAAQSKTFDGYTFVCSGKKATLYDMDSSVVHTWNCPNNIEGWGDLLRDSSIIVPAKSSITSINKQMIALAGGRLQIINWKGEVTWDYTYADTNCLPHHDGEPVYRTNDPKEKPTFLLICATAWGDKITELKPKGSNDAEVVWEWFASDHTCETNCTDRIEVLDKTKGGMANFGKENFPDWMHSNNVSYNPILDQVVLSVKGYYEFIVIDHSTTTAQAKGTSGGKYGKGGSILYRWGNPDSYGASGDVQLNGPHHACWVPNTMPGTDLAIPGGGNFMVVDNGGKRVMEVECPGDKKGVYPRNANQAFAPAQPLWKYSPSGLQANEGSIQKMPNGNYVICTGGVSMGGGFEKTQFGNRGSTIYEVDASGTVVWKLTGFGTSCEGYRYAYSYLGGGTPVKKPATVIKPGDMRITHTTSGKVILTLENCNTPATLSLYTLSGREIMNSAAATGDHGWTLASSIPSGMYCAKISSGTSVVWDHLPINR